MKLEITRRELCAYFIMKEISHSDISGITTKAPCGVALMGERHVRIEISDFVMRTFVHTAFLRKRCLDIFSCFLSIWEPDLQQGHTKKER